MARRPTKRGTAPLTPLPTKQQVLDYIRDNPGRVGKREIARAFEIGGAERIGLKKLLREMEGEGTLDRGHGRRLAPAGTLPEVSLVDLIEVDRHGDLIGRPAEWKQAGPPPIIVVEAGGATKREFGQLSVGDRILARLQRSGANRYEAKLIRRLQAAPDQILGVFELAEGLGRIRPTDKKQRQELLVPKEFFGGAEEGEIVLAEALPGRVFGLRHAKVVERIGRMGDPRSLSLISIHMQDIPTRFSDEALAQAKTAKPVPLGKRTDLREIPLVTIDPDDARDHDDAIWAEADTDPQNPGGWHVMVAIADVAHYVTPGSALDRDARERGNSAYFPDRVVPMLPETLSADLCSLMPGEPRACLAVHMWFDATGEKKRHRFVRGLMRSAASLNYTQVQRAVDGQPDEMIEPLMEGVIRPLYGAYAAVSAARDRRQPLAIDLPERQVLLGENGYIAAIRQRERFASHRLVEDFMIMANVAAAETLEDRRQPCMYRVHEEPSADKLESLRTFLESLNLRLAKGQVLRPILFNRILEQAKDKPYEHLVNQVILRSQSQAIYSPTNQGHFGLALRRYAHFTSPIRRYSDVLVHRGLIRGLGLGSDGLSESDEEHFAATGEHISMTERRAMMAERDALDRFTANFMSQHVGAEFTGRISGVTRFGLFITLSDTGADGLLPISGIGDDYYVHDEARHALTGRRTGRTFRLGDMVQVRLAEADLVTGGLKLELADGKAGQTGRPVHRGRSGRPANLKAKPKKKNGRPRR